MLPDLLRTFPQVERIAITERCGVSTEQAIGRSEAQREQLRVGSSSLNGTRPRVGSKAEDDGMMLD